MKVEQLMTPSPATCGLSDNLAQVVERMWDANCGIVPIVDDAARVLGVITDRDICVAAATRGLSPADITVAEIQRKPVVTCRPEDDLQSALAQMKQYHVRRLPVTAEQGVLHGILSLDDIILHAGTRDTVTATDVLTTLKAILAPRLPVRHVA